MSENGDHNGAASASSGDARSEGDDVDGAALRRDSGKRIDGGETGRPTDIVGADPQGEEASKTPRVSSDAEPSPLEDNSDDEAAATVLADSNHQGALVDAPSPRGTVSTPIEPGTLISSTFRIKRLLGSGGMGEVYLAEHTFQATLHALKRLSPSLTDDPQCMSLFRREAELLRRLNSDVIVGYDGVIVHEVGDAKSVLLAMEFADGPPLKKKVEVDGPISETYAVQLMSQLAEGLSAAHRIGVFHRDLSPDNIILSREEGGLPKIIDFGIARDSNAEDATVLSASFAGKVKYAAPEQFGLCGGDIGPWSDIYSLGLTIAYALTSEPLLDAADIFDARDLRKHRPSLEAIPEGLRPIMERMLAPSREDRFADMDELLAALKGGASREVLEETVDATVIAKRPALPGVPTSMSVDSEVSQDTVESFESREGVAGQARKPATIFRSTPALGANEDGAVSPSKKVGKRDGAWKPVAAATFIALVSLAGGGWLLMSGVLSSRDAPSPIEAPTTSFDIASVPVRGRGNFFVPLSGAEGADGAVPVLRVPTASDAVSDAEARRVLNEVEAQGGALRFVDGASSIKPDVLQLLDQYSMFPQSPEFGISFAADGMPAVQAAVLRSGDLTSFSAEVFYSGDNRKIYADILRYDGVLFREWGHTSLKLGPGRNLSDLQASSGRFAIPDRSVFEGQSAGVPEPLAYIRTEIADDPEPRISLGAVLLYAVDGELECSTGDARIDRGSHYYLTPTQTEIWLPKIVGCLSAAPGDVDFALFPIVWLQGG